MNSRRLFLQQSVGLGLAAMLPEMLLAENPATSAQGTSPQTGLLSKMQWMNEPASSKVEDGKLVVHSRAKTDFWRKTYYEYITDNGHFFHLQASGDFTFQARVNGQYAALYDQAGLMIRLNAENWVKCGTEFFDGARHASVVFTRDFSDWSTMADLSRTGPVWWRAVRKKNSIETLCSLDGKTFTSVRQGYFPTDQTVQVGVMCCAPEGPGFEAVFDELKLEQG